MVCVVSVGRCVDRGAGEGRGGREGGGRGKG